jgi:hypothetical protein
MMLLSDGISHISVLLNMFPEVWMLPEEVTNFLFLGF